MIVQVNVVGVFSDEQVAWPEGWPIPREGETVGLPSGAQVYVRNVSWYPHGEEPGDLPFVYIVLGPPNYIVLGPPNK